MIALYLQEKPALVPESLLNEIKSVFSRWKLDMIFNVSRDLQKPGILFSKLINTTGYSIRPGVFDERLKKESRESLLSELKTKIQFATRTKKNVAWSEDEIVRLLAGRRIYENLNGSMKGVWSYLQESSLFGFLLTRTEALMRDALTRTQTRFNEYKLNELYTRASIWQPELYSMADIIDDFYKFGIIVEGDAVTAFKELHAFDMREYKLAGSTLSERSVDPERIALPVERSQSLDVRSFKVLLNQMREQMTEDIKEYIKESIRECEARAMSEIQSVLNERRFEPEYSRNSIEFDMNDYDASEHPILPDVETVPMETEFSAVESFPPNQGGGEPEERISYQAITTGDSLDNIDILYFNKIFQKCRYRIFSSDDAWHDLFHIAVRPEKSAWDAFINRSFNDGFISVIYQDQPEFYRCNLKQMLTFEGISYQRIKNYLRKHAHIRSVFTASSSRTSIKNNLRPSISDWVNYLDDLVSDGELRLVSEVFEIPKRYQLFD